MSRKSEENLLEEACKDRFLSQWPDSRVVTTRTNVTSGIDFVVELAKGGLVLLEKKSGKAGAGKARLSIGWSPDQIEPETLQAILRAIRLDRPIVYSTYTASRMNDPKNKKKLTGFKVSLARTKTKLTWKKLFPNDPLPEAARWKVVGQSAKKQGRYLVATHRLKDGKSKQINEYKLEIAKISNAIYESTLLFKTFPFNIPHSHKITENGKITYDRTIDEWEQHAKQKGLLGTSNVVSKVCSDCDASFLDTSSQLLCHACFVVEQKQRDKLRAANQKKAKQLITKAKKLVRSDDWKETGDALKGLQQDWKAVHPLPQKVAEKLWQKFRATTQIFFDRRAAHFESMDAERDENRRKAEGLIKEAKRWSGSDDWKKAADKIKSLQQQWKTVHPLPRVCADDLWRKFQDLCQSFFDRRTAHYGAKSR
jgi:hypothetical protein